MTKHYAESIAWTDHPQSRTFTTPQQFTDEFLAGWIQASSDIRIVGSRYLDGGDTVVCTFTAVGTQDGPLGPFPATGKAFRVAAVRDVALRLGRAGRRWRHLLRPGLAPDAAGPDAAAIQPVGGVSRSGGRRGLRTLCHSAAMRQGSTAAQAIV